MVAEAGWNNWKGNLSIPMYSCSQKKAIWMESSILERSKGIQIFQVIKHYFSFWIFLVLDYNMLYLDLKTELQNFVSHVC